MTLKNKLKNFGIACSLAGILNGCAAGRRLSDGNSVDIDMLANRRENAIKMFNTNPRLITSVGTKREYFTHKGIEAQLRGLALLYSGDKSVKIGITNDGKGFTISGYYSLDKHGYALDSVIEDADANKDGVISRRESIDLSKDVLRYIIGNKDYNP